MTTEQINVFFLETELQALAYLSIRETLEDGSVVAPFVTLESIYSYLQPLEPEVQFLSKKMHGWLGRIAKFRKNLAKLARGIRDKNTHPKQINYHTARIDGLFSNLIITYLGYHFPSASIHVRLIPDGAINIFSTQISASKSRKLLRWNKNLAARLMPDMRVLPIYGDELGADAEVVDRIYSFNGVETSYPQHKIHRIPLLSAAAPIDQSAKKPRALVIGQNFLQLGTADREFVEAVADRMKVFLSAQGVEEVDYIPHPRSSYDEFFLAGYNRIARTELCSEQLIVNGKYTHVVSCYSSVLLNSKLILGAELEVSAIGLEEFPFRDPNQCAQLKAAYDKVGIVIFPLT